MVEKKKIILDCDSGHDDAIAIMLAAKNEMIDLLGISVVAGNQTIEKTVKNALNVCQYLGLDVPVYQGCGQPMIRNKPEVAGDIHGETGPMTDLAMAMRLCPDIIPKIKEIVLMGGCYQLGNVTPAAEFNVITDADAAHVVFTSGRKIVMAGLDVTRKVLCYPEIIERMSKHKNPAGQLFVDLMTFFSKTQKEVYGWEGGPLHDPVTIAYLIDPTVLTLKEMYTEIDIRSTQSYGRTNCDFFHYSDNKPNSFVAIDIDTPKFWDIVEKGIEAYNE